MHVKTFRGLSRRGRASAAWPPSADTTSTIATGSTRGYSRSGRPPAAAGGAARLAPPSTIVVGWPLETSGRVGRQARRVKIVTDALEAKTSVPIVLWDERFTSVQAERVLIQGGVRRADRRQVVDKVAATLILQSWLDGHSTAD